VPKKDPMHNPTRRLCTKVRRVTRDLAPILRAGFTRKLPPRSIATIARNMGAHIPHTILRVVVGTRKMEHKNLTSALQSILLHS
jgi:hypothetical protein